MVVVVVMEKGEMGEIAVVVSAGSRSAGSVTALAANAANAGSAGNLLFPTDPAFARRQRTRETPHGEVEEEEVEEVVSRPRTALWSSGQGRNKWTCTKSVAAESSFALAKGNVGYCHAGIGRLLSLY